MNDLKGETQGGRRNEKVEWSVLIAGIGVRVVEAKDIDGAYAAAMTAHDCKFEDVLAVFRQSLVRASYGSGCYHSPTKKHRHGPKRSRTCQFLCGFRLRLQASAMPTSPMRTAGI